MNFLYIHLSPSDFGFKHQQQWSFNEIPEYVYKSMYQTRMTNPSSNIMFLCNKNINNNRYINQIGYEVIDVNSVRSDILEEYIDTYMQKNSQKDAFWLLTLLRYVYVEMIMQSKNIDSIFFVEGDNLIYVDVDKLASIISSRGMFTCCETAPGNCSSGVFFVNDMQSIIQYNRIVLDVLKKGSFVTDMSSIKTVLDMHIMNLYTFDGLPNKSGIIFDPSDWGFLLGGDNHKHEDSFIDSTHMIGRFILSNANKISINRENNKYFLKYNGSDNIFVNLHIANKQNIDKFLTYKI